MGKSGGDKSHIVMCPFDGSRCCYNSALYHSKYHKGAVHKTQKVARDLVVLITEVATVLVILSVVSPARP